MILWWRSPSSPMSLRKWVVLRERSLSMSLSSWLGGKTAPVSKKQSKKKNIALKLSRREWNKKRRMNLSRSLLIFRRRLSKMRRGISKKLSVVFIIRIRSWRRRPWASDILLNTTRGRSIDLRLIIRIWVVTLLFRMVLRSSMSREGWIRPRKSRVLRRRLWCLKSHCSKLCTTLKRKKSC